MEYSVGQILFLIGDSNKVVPIQVVEEVIRTTLEGKEKTYIVKFPDKKETTIDIKKIKGSLFNSKQEVKSYMFENAKNAIEEMLAIADEMSLTVFNKPTMQELTFVEPEPEETVVEENEKMQPEIDDGIIRVDLGNGKFGKIKTEEFNSAGASQ